MVYMLSQILSDKTEDGGKQCCIVNFYYDYMRSHRKRIPRIGDWLGSNSYHFSNWS